MKLNQGLMVAAMVVGSLAAVGCSNAGDEEAIGEGTTMEQASVVGEQGTVPAVAANAGFTQDARRNHRGGFHHGERPGGRHGQPWGWRHGDRRIRRAWWRFW